jgi:hypothetical protein
MPTFDNTFLTREHLFNISEFFKSSVDVFSIHDLFTRLPRRLMSWLYQELLKKILMPKLMIECQGQWRAGPMNRIIFQPYGTPMVPIFSPRRRLYEALYEPEAIIPLFHYSNRTT